MSIAATTDKAIISTRLRGKIAGKINHTDKSREDNKIDILKPIRLTKRPRGPAKRKTKPLSITRDKINTRKPNVNPPLSKPHKKTYAGKKIATIDPAIPRNRLFKMGPPPPENLASRMTACLCQ